MRLPSIFSTERFKNPTAKGLYGFAWGLEIIATILGLLISFAIFSSAFAGAKDADPSIALLNAFIAFAPFFMVALSELAKIPIAEAMYTASRRVWQFTFGFALLFLAIITFETVFNGLERNFTFLKYKIDAKWTELQNARAKVADEQGKIESLERLTIDVINQQYSDRIAELTKEREVGLKIINAQIEKLEAESGSGAIKELRSEHARKIAEKVELEKGISNQSQQQLQRLNAQLERKTIEIKDLRDHRFKLSGLWKGDERARIDEDIRRTEKERSDLESRIYNLEQTAANAQQIKIDELDKAISNLNERIARSVARTDAESAKRRSPLENRAKDIQAEFNVGRQFADARRNKQKDQLENNESAIQELGDKKAAVLVTQRGLENDINELALGVQVYRFALYLAGEREAHKMDPKYVTVVALVWFGSLSAVVALTGVLLALGAFVIEYGAPRTDQPRYMHKVLNSLRRTLFSVRKIQRREKVITKTVPEEVIVEKEVIKTVPKEVVVKEIVHVPVLVGGEHKVKTETIASGTEQHETVKLGGEFKKPTED